MKNGSHSKNTRESILDATERMLAVHGYKKMTIDDLAQEVGIGKGSVYLHFSSKEEIALSHIDRIIERLKDKLEAVARKKAPVDERLNDMLVLRVLHRFDSIQTYSKTLSELLAHVRSGLLERRKRHFEEEAEILAAVIAEGQADGVYGPGDPVELARTLVMATNSLLPFSLSAFELGKRTALNASVKRVAALLIRGLRS
jgi:AcrR family transcriptional regulator